MDNLLTSNKAWQYWHIDNDLKVGTKVKIIGGPFTGMYGLIEEVDAPNEKIVLNVDLFGQET